MASYGSYRKSKETAPAEMVEIQPDTPSFLTSVTDFSRSHGQGHEAESSEDESQTRNLRALIGIILQWCKSLSDIKIPEPLTFILKEDWASATEKEKQICEEKVDDACRAVCRVIGSDRAKL